MKLNKKIELNGSGSETFMFESVVGHKNARNESMSVDTDQIYL